MRIQRAAAIVAALLLTGCTATVQLGQSSPTTPDASQPVASPSDSTPVVTSPDATSAATTPAVSPAAPGDGAATVLPNGATWLYDVDSEAARPSGAQSSATLLGDATATSYPNSTDQWLGCEGDPDITNYQLGGQYSQLVGHLGQRSTVPAGVVAQVVVYYDGEPVTAWQIDQDGGMPIQLTLTGVNVLSFAATLSSGECSPSEESYLVFADTYVH